MPEKTYGRILLSLVVLLFGYLAVGNLFHRAIYPLPPPDPASYPKFGDVLVSRSEGFIQKVTGIKGEWITSELVVEPNSPGPPLHYHDTFDELFSVVEGTLHVRVHKDVKQISPGETFLVAAGIPHRPFNPTAVRVVLASGEPSIPITFAACLVQLYALMDAEVQMSGLDMALQMSVIDPICDTHIADIPAPLWETLKAVLAPAARLLGYRNYYPELALH